MCADYQIHKWISIMILHIVLFFLVWRPGSQRSAVRLLPNSGHFDENRHAECNAPMFAVPLHWPNRYAALLCTPSNFIAIEYLYYVSSTALLSIKEMTLYALLRK